MLRTHPTELADLRHHEPALDLQRITHVRVIDVVGSIDPSIGSHDCEGRMINEPFPTPFFTGGFDLDAVAALGETTTSYDAWCVANALTGENAAPDAIADGFREPNLVRFATSGGLSLTAGASETELVFHRRSYRAIESLRVEWSADLETWLPLAGSVAGSAVASAVEEVAIQETGGPLKQVSVRLPSSHAARFFRLAANLDDSP